MKKLINCPADVVGEMLIGLVAHADGLMLLGNVNAIVRSDIESVRDLEVTVISGGGSGHEPAHTGYVGPGMLHAAVAGDVFSPPSVDAVLATLRVACGSRGALIVIGNTAGDRLNFGLAAEIARAARLNIEVLLVGDDVALDVAREAQRGMAGTVFVQKIAGAVAAAGGSLAEVTTAARNAAASVGTMSVALGSCTVPAAGAPSFSLSEFEIEFGLGSEGEAGLRRETITPVRDVVAELLSAIIARQYLRVGNRVALLVNDLGGTPPMEIEIVTNMALEFLHGIALNVERVWTGRFLTTLEMPGVSLSLMLVDDERLRRLDAPAQTLAWPSSTTKGRIDINRPRMALPSMRSGDDELHADGRGCAEVLRSGLEAIAWALVANELNLCKLDQMSGAGDLGVRLTQGAQAIRGAIETLDLDDPAASLSIISGLLRRTIGGATGPLYSVFTLRAARSLAQAPRVDAVAWADAFLAGCAGITQLGAVQSGDRTMLDALLPAAETFADAIRAGRPIVEALAGAVAAASDGAAATATMVPRRGRAQYFGARVMSHIDAGAVAAAIWLEAVCAVIARRTDAGADAPT